MSVSGTSSADRATQIAQVVRRCWGHASLRPQQAEAIEAGLAQRDSLVVILFADKIPGPR
jgi:superfamily II DNA helicase RecQ